MEKDGDVKTLEGVKKVLQDFNRKAKRGRYHLKERLGRR